MKILSSFLKIIFNKTETNENTNIIWYFSQYPLTFTQFACTTNLLTYYQKLGASSFKKKEEKKVQFKAKIPI